MDRDTNDGCLVFVLIAMALTALAIYVVVASR